MPTRSTIACAIALLLLPALARADARDDARRLFKQGMALIAESHHMQGARLLEQAYELKPHPSVLYNIGLAYADAGALDEALSTFQRYLATGPDDTAAVERLITLLRRQKAEDEEPVPPPSEEPAPSTTGEAPVQAVAAPGLAALLERLEALARKLEGGDDFDESPTAEIIDPSALESKSDQDIYAEEIVSAARGKVSPVDAPAALTVITADELRLSGITNLPDALRRVPGISVLTMGPGDTNLAMRGFNQRISNKMLTLVDGRSTYLDFLGGTFYKTLSIDIADIDRIEVIRGPGSTLYGANAFGGVVNIITKKPGAEQGGQVAISGGNGESLNGNLRFSGRKGIFGFRGSVGYEQTNRYEREFGERADYEATATDPDLAVRTLRANTALSLRPEEDVQLTLSGGVNYLFDNFMAIGLFRDFWMQGFTSDLRFDFAWKGLQVRTFWNSFNAHASPSWQPVGGQDLSTDPRSHIIDAEASYTGRLMSGPVSHDLSVGAGYRLKTIDWSYIGAPRLEQHVSAFIEDQVTFIPQLQLVAGFRFDQHPLVGFTPSPRAAILIKPTARQSVRISASTAFRTPTFLESYLDLVVPTGVVSGVGIRSRGSTDLRPENIVGVELGYVFEQSDFINFDVQAWYQRVNQLIALGPIDPPDSPQTHSDGRFVAGSSTFGNLADPFHGFGAELAVHAFPVRGLDLRGSYSYAYWMDQARRAAGEPAADQRHPAHTANFGASYRAPFGLDANVDLHVVSNVVIPERSFDEAGNVLVEACESPAYPMVSARVGYRLLDDRLELGVTGFNLAAWGTGGHREHCLATRVGARVLGSATYRF